MTATVLAWVFWGTAMLLLFTYAGYPALLAFMVRIRRARLESPGVPMVEAGLDMAAVLVVRNEERSIRARLENLLATDSPALKEIIVVCDGCTDATAEMAEQFPDARVRVLHVNPGRGKPAGVNAGVLAAISDVVVLCDVRQRFLPDTLPRLLSWFADPATGAVSGALEIEPSTSGTGQGVDAYWKMEKLIRRLESDLDSSVGCTGAVYAVRRAAFQPIKEDTLLDDVVIPMQIAAQGLRVRFCPEAVAFDPQTLAGPSEHRRKVRTLAGNFQLLFRHPQWLVPWGHRLWWKLIAHKYLRLTGPLMLAILLFCSWMLGGQPLYRGMFLAQMCLYAGAVLAWCLPGLKVRMLSMAAGFLFLQVCIVRGFFWWLRMKPRAGWK
ncbi:MAG: glycosyltransferase family 2 protein [Verrucomicrobiaceae bacterium]|nr:glycosyltransferase family 2 protein [Verrucomicrobiaceae bacterium]